MYKNVVLPCLSAISTQLEALTSFVYVLEFGLDLIMNTYVSILSS